MKNLQYFINEAIKIDDKEISESIDEFYDLQTEIEALTKKLKDAKKKFGEFGAQVSPLLDAMSGTGERLAETDEYIVKVKKFAHDRTTSSYKDAFNEALTKVNGATKKILEESLASAAKVTKIGHAWEIGKVEEANALTTAISKIKNALKSFLNMFKKESKTIDEGNKALKAISLS